MIPPTDITDDTRDITDLWRRMTGDRVASAKAHMRGRTLTAVTIDGKPRLVMCRAGACTLITPQEVARIESRPGSSKRF